MGEGSLKISKKIGLLRKAGLAAAFMLLLGTSRPAYADLFNMDWTGTFGTGSAVLTASPTGTDQWLVTAVSGTQNGLALTLLAPGTYGGNDNVIYQPPDFSFVVDRSGLDFSDGTNDYNIFDNDTSVTPAVYHECSSAVESDCLGTQADNADAIALAITPSNTSPVPEPADVALMTVGLLVVAGLFRRRLAKAYMR